MGYDKSTHLAEGISRASVKPLDYIINNSQVAIENIEKGIGLPIEILILLFLCCFGLFIMILWLKIKSSGTDI